MLGDVTFTVRLNSKAQYHLSDLMKKYPDMSRNKLMSYVLEKHTPDIEKEREIEDNEIKALKRRIKSLEGVIRVKGAEIWKEDAMKPDSIMRLRRLFPDGKAEYFQKVWKIYGPGGI